VSSPPSAEEMIALNREIASMIRSGIPLEVGLRGIYGGTRSRLGRLAEKIARRLSEGQSLPQALAAERADLEPGYAAVVEAGLAANELPEALESISNSGQLLIEIRRRAFIASIYPMICISVAYGMFCFLVTFIAPRVIYSEDMFKHSWPVEWMKFFVRNRDYFAMVIPSVILATVVLTYLLRRSVTRGIWNFFTSFRWVVGQNLTLARFTSMLAVQLERHTPLPKAFVAAADSTGRPILQRQARIVAEQLSEGVSFYEALQSVRCLPPMLRWMFANGEKQGVLVPTLYQMTDVYSRRAVERAATTRIWMPVMITYLTTGMLGLLYGLAFFIPLRALLEGMMQE